MTDRIPQHFGKELSQEQRIVSYDYIENFISAHVKNWDTPPDTDTLAAAFASEVNKFELPDLAFLICHTGYIPEFYGHDSSQETLYSKLIEVLVCEWALRVGFKDSAIQKQKSSKEDVTIQVDNIVIVCDAKSYRLGRSQAAPNVKDVIKKADYEKWQSTWEANEPHVKYGKFQPIGGLITFPSLHKSKKASDVYLYSSDKSKPIVFLFYEHLAYFLVKGYAHQRLIDLIINYPELFKSTTKDQSLYFDTVLKYLFSATWDNFVEYSKLSLDVVNEKVANTINRINTHLEAAKHRIDLEVKAIAPEKVYEALKESRLENECGQLLKQLDNIRKFRGGQ